MVKLKSDRPARRSCGRCRPACAVLQSVLAVAVGALRQQNADIDADIANLLQRSVADIPCEEQVQKLESMLSRLPRPPSSDSR